jgi:hypothetical protein
MKIAKTRYCGETVVAGKAAEYNEVNLSKQLNA